MTETNSERAKRAQTAIRLLVIWLFVSFSGVIYLSFSSKGDAAGDGAEVLKVAERLAVVAKYGQGVDEKTGQSLADSAVELEPNESAKQIIQGELPDGWKDADLSATYRLMAEELAEPSESRRTRLEQIALEGLTRFGITGIFLGGLGLFGVVTSFLTKPEANVLPGIPTDLDSWGVLGVFFGWHVFGFLLAGIVSATLAGSIDGFLLILLAQSSLYGLMLFIFSQMKFKSDLKLFRSFSWSWVGRGYLLSLATVMTVNIMISSVSGETPRSENPVLTLFADAPLWQFACLGVLVVLVGPFFEELMFRGWLFGSLRERWGRWPALIISAALFAMIHGDAPALPALFALGLIFGWLYHKSGSLWVPFLVHACWNATTFSLLIAVMP